MYYYIKNKLEKTEKLDFKGKSGQFVAVLTSAEWLDNRDKFDMGIEMDIDLSAIHSTKAEINYDSLTGTFSIPDRDNIQQYYQLQALDYAEPRTLHLRLSRADSGARPHRP